MGALPTRERRRTELGEEIQCARCEEFWPADPEFFFFSKGQPHSWCKACYRADPNVLAKNERWQEKQRKGSAARPARPPLEFAPLIQAMGLGAGR